MNRYTGDECAVCNVTFNDNDDVVVCPVCGTPHHRACYNKETGCANNSWHGTTTYEEEKRKKQEETAKKCEDTVSKKCSKCGSQNPPTGLFCQVCGNSLFKQTEEPQNQGGFSFTPPPISPNPFTTPFGGLSPEEEIDGVSIKELAVFVGDNSHYFLPKMKELHFEEKILSWNWSAFFFDFFYFFYRKMYLLGSLILAFWAITTVPAFIYMFETIGYSNPDLIPQNILALGTIANICSFLFTGVRVLCGLFANYLYTKTAFKKINKIRRDDGMFDTNNPDYINKIASKGRTSHKAVIILGISYVVVSNVLGILMTFLMM